MAMLSSVFAASATERATPSERRALARAARALWPQLTPRAARALSKFGSIGTGGPGTPADFAARVVAFVGDELDAQADGAPPDLDRLVETIAVTFDAARTFASLGIHPVARAQRRAVFGVRAGLGAVGLSFSGSTFASLDPSFVAAHPTVLAFVAMPSLLALAMAHDLTKGKSLEPGVYFVRPRFERAYAEFLAALIAQLPEHPAWRRVVPTESTALASRDLASLMRYVWSPGLMRKACDHWLSPERVRLKPAPTSPAPQIQQSKHLQIASGERNDYPWPPENERPHHK
jgi:hypothetical protein